jgi:hypothetical protein
MTEMTAAPEATAAPAERRRRFSHHWPFHFLVRMGFAIRGVTYAIMGVLTVAIALRSGTLGTTADQSGALALISHTTLGRLAMVGIALGLLAYAVWKIEQGIRGGGPEGGGGSRAFDRTANISGGLAYLIFFSIAVGALIGDRGDSAHETAAGVLSWPGGPGLVGGGGAILLGVSLYQIVDAVRYGFAKDCKLEEMTPKQCLWFLHAGRVGLVGRAAVFALVGYFLLRTAITYTPGSAVGVDGALQRVREQPLGQWLVGVTAAGLLVFSGFSFLEGRFRKL